MKADVTEKACHDWLTTKVRDMMALLELLSKDHCRRILKMMANRNGFVIVDHSELLLSVA